LGRHKGEAGFDSFLGTGAWLSQNWEKLISLPEVGLTGDECRAARAMVACLEKS